MPSLRSASGAPQRTPRTGPGRVTIQCTRKEQGVSLVSAGGARRGRRDNGLHVAEYAVAGDVDPRVGEHLLDVLAAGGIAAYLQPSSDLDPVTRTTNLPARPTDRLFVDRAHLDLAREYLAKLAVEAGAESITPEEPVAKKEPDVDAEWARIVAGFDTDVDPKTMSWPDAENISDKPQEHNRRKTDRVNGHDPMAPPEEPPKRRGLTSATEISGVTVPREEPSLLDGLDTFGTNLPGEDDERYVPPAPAADATDLHAGAAGRAGAVRRFRAVRLPDRAAHRPELRDADRLLVDPGRLRDTGLAAAHRRRR